MLRVEDALTGLQELGASASEALRATYVKMIRSGGQRFVTKPAALPDIDALINELPNSKRRCRIFEAAGAVLSSDDPLELEPMLLSGTRHRQDALRAPFRRLLGTGYNFIGMSSLTAGWIRQERPPNGRTRSQAKCSTRWSTVITPTR